MIKVENLNKVFGNKTIFKDLNLDFSTGVNGIVGRNGIGKTTLFHCITGITDYSGRISSAVPNFKNALSLLPVDLYFYPKMKAIEFLEFALFAKKKTSIDINKWNEAFHLPLEEYAENYSTGMKKKLMLMLMLIADDPLVIMDEPFNGLDVESVNLLSKLLNRIKQHSNKCILLSSHNLDTLMNCSDRIFFIKNSQDVICFEKEQFGSILSEFDTISDENIEIIQKLTTQEW